MTIYQSIYECPAWNFSMAAKERKYLLRLDTYHGIANRVITKDQEQELEQSFRNMSDEFTDHFGFSETAAHRLELYRDILELRADLLLTGNEALKPRIELLVEKLNQIDTGKSADIFEIAAHLSKYAGYDISPMKTTVVEFYSKLYTYEKNAETSNSGRKGDTK